MNAMFHIRSKHSRDSNPEHRLQNRGSAFYSYVSITSGETCYIPTKASGYVHERALMSVWLLNRTVGRLVPFLAT